MESGIGNEARATEKPINYLATAAVIATASIFGLTYSLTAPLIAVQLAQRGYGEFTIGLNAAMHAAGVLLIAPVLPRLAVRFGARGLIVGALLLTAVLLALFPVVPAVWLWFPLRLGFGIGAEALFVMSETWTNELSNDRVRGRTMAIYTASLSLGMVGGPALLSVLGAQPVAFWVGAAICVAAVLFVAGPWVTAPAHVDRPHANPLRYFRMAPIAIATTVLNAAIETAGLSFIALYASGMGWSEQGAMRLISMLMLGAIILQLPIGWLADRVNPRRLALGLAMLSAASALVWPWMLGTYWLAYALIFVWGWSVRRHLYCHVDHGGKPLQRQRPGGYLRGDGSGMGRGRLARSFARRGLRWARVLSMACRCSWPLLARYFPCSCFSAAARPDGAN